MNPRNQFGRLMSTCPDRLSPLMSINLGWPIVTLSPRV
nr:MAG TPA: vacuolar protein sorting-associated protein [Caudoviricetes sp.]